MKRFAVAAVLVGGVVAVVGLVLVLAASTLGGTTVGIVVEFTGLGCVLAGTEALLR